MKSINSDKKLEYKLEETIEELLGSRYVAVCLVDGDKILIDIFELLSVDIRQLKYPIPKVKDYKAIQELSTQVYLEVLFS